MGSPDIGKRFEADFKKNWQLNFPNTFIFRLSDQMGGFSGPSGQNPCDFLCMPHSMLLMVECKAHSGASINWADIPQYDRLVKYKDCKNVCPGILVWFYDHDSIIWVPIQEAIRMHEDGEKSIGLRMLQTNYKKSYNIFKVPTEKKRVYLQADYTKLLTFAEEGRFNNERDIDRSSTCN